MPFPAEIPVDVYSGINLNLWFVAVVLQFVCSGLIFIRAKSTKDVQILRSLLHGYGVFALSMGINRIFFLWAYLTPSWENYYLFLGIGYVFATGALVPVIFVLEKYFTKKTHFIFTVLTGILVIFSLISIFLPDELLSIRSLLQILGFGTSLIWFFLYFYIIRITTGQPRKKAIIIVFAVVLAAIGFTIDSEMVISMQIIPYYIAPILYIVGVLILTMALFKRDGLG